MNLRLAWTLSAVFACTQEAQLFESVTRDGGGNGLADTGPGDASTGADAGPQLDSGATDSGTSLPIPRLGLATGLDHVCAIVDGGLWCWGNGALGQLGVGENDERTRPVRIGAGEDWVSVCGGEAHTCALRRDGSTYCWGRNQDGELGLGHFSSRNAPARIGAASFVSIACGGYNTCALTREAALFCWGDNFEGKLGRGDDESDATAPTPVLPSNQFRSVSVGQGHVCAIAQNGALWCWGRNTNAQLGLQGNDAEHVRVPTRVPGLNDVREVAAGQRHTCAVDHGGKLWCWGTNSEGSLGLDSTTSETTSAPSAVGEASDWSDISVRWFHSCARRGGRDLYCWGRNAEGQLGVGDMDPRGVPTRLDGTQTWSEVIVGHFHTCGIRAGEVVCWGNNEAGQVGAGDTARRDRPTLVAFP
jgi:hypothetical protein